MIFASDLDRTIIYSQRAIAELGRPEELPLTPVEQKDSNWVAYMTKTSHSLLKKLSERCLFVPVTTRTTAQFSRFVIFKKDIPIKYAITSNGANILFNGQPMKEWSLHLHNRLKMESVSQAELVSILSKEGINLDGEKRQAEQWFFYYLLNCLPSDSDRIAIERLADKYGWRTSLQGRKLYLIPKAISKGNALNYICNFEGVVAFAGAGDSMLDWDFLKDCQYRFVPNHGELARQLMSVSGEEFSMVTTTSGVKAGEEIIQKVYKLLD